MMFLHALRRFELEYALERIQGLNKNIRILDFGAGDGFVLNELKKKGFYNSIGIEIYNTNYPINDKNIIKYDGELDNFPDLGSFDLIFSSNVLEHVSSVEEYLLFFNERLNANGRQVHIMPTHYWKFYNALFYYWQVIKFLLKSVFLLTSDLRRNPSSENYKTDQKRDRKESPFFIGRHGSRGSSFEEFVLFNPKEYCTILKSNSFNYEHFRIPLIYSGHYFFGKVFSVKFRSFISNFIGYSCHCFIINKASK